jgi:hypothetical protein
MRKLFGKAVGGCLMLLCAASLYATGQHEKEKPAADHGKRPTHISPADQRAIEALFKGVDQSKYHLQFENGKRTIGTKKVEMSELEQVKKIRNPGEAAGWIILIVEGNDVIYVLAVGGSELESVLGKEKAAKLNQIVAKYATH